MSVEDHVVSFSLEINVEEALTNIRRAQTLLFRTLALMQRLGLPENIQAAVTQIQRLISIMNQLRLAAIALQAASGPIGWGLAAVGVATTIASGVSFADGVADSIYDSQRGT